MRRLLTLLLLGCLPLGCGTSVILVDAGVDASEPVDISGTWHDCFASMTFAPDGTASGVEHSDGCTLEGTWRMTATDVLEVVWTGGTCGVDELILRRVILVEEGLTLIDVESAAVRRLASDSTPRGIWLLEGTEGTESRSTTASVVGDPSNRFGSGCYWSTDGECGGLFSCTGRVLVWAMEDGGRFSASTSCSGGCPCGSVLEGTTEPDGTLSADYRGVNCERNLEGSLTARRLDL